MLRALDAPEQAQIRRFVELLDETLAQLNRKVGLEEDSSVLVRQSVLQSSFPVVLLYRQREPEAAWRYLIGVWQQLAQAFGVPARHFWPGEVRSASSPSLLFELSREQAFLAAFHAAVFERLRGEVSVSRGQRILQRLMSHLALSYDQLGRAFNVSGETLRRWDRGSHPIPDERMAELVRVDADLGRLLSIFVPERLPQAIRRKAELFDGESALDWILRGRISEVANRYAVALVYQG